MGVEQIEKSAVAEKKPLDLDELTKASNELMENNPIYNIPEGEKIFSTSEIDEMLKIGEPTQQPGNITKSADHSTVPPVEAAPETARDYDPSKTLEVTVRRREDILKDQEVGENFDKTEWAKEFAVFTHLTNSHGHTLMEELYANEKVTHTRERFTAIRLIQRVQEYLETHTSSKHITTNAAEAIFYLFLDDVGWIIRFIQGITSETGAYSIEDVTRLSAVAQDLKKLFPQSYVIPDADKPTEIKELQLEIDRSTR